MNPVEEYQAALKAERRIRKLCARIEADSMLANMSDAALIAECKSRGLEVKP